MKMNASLIYLALLLGVSLLWASEAADTTLADDKQERYDHIDQVWQGRFDPIMEVSYGYGIPQHKNFAADFARIGSVELKLGYSEIKQKIKTIWSIDERYAFTSYAAKDLNVFEEDDAASGKTETKMSRFGFGRRSGDGYSFGAGSGSFKLLPYHQTALLWTRVTSERPAELSPEDISILDRYEGSYRFGQLGEAGIKLRPIKFLSLSGSYEFATIFPRHVFWEWLGSVAIFHVAMSAISLYSNKVTYSSPAFGPIMNFLLKNGLSYAFYHATKYKMNWPFNSEKPLTFESFKLGLVFTF